MGAKPLKLVPFDCMTDRFARYKPKSRIREKLLIYVIRIFQQSVRRRDRNSSGDGAERRVRLRGSEREKGGTATRGTGSLLLF